MCELDTVLALWEMRWFWSVDRGVDRVVGVGVLGGRL